MKEKEERKENNEETIEAKRRVDEEEEGQSTPQICHIYCMIYRQLGNAYKIVDLIFILFLFFIYSARFVFFKNNIYILLNISFSTQTKQLFFLGSYLRYEKVNVQSKCQGKEKSPFQSSDSVSLHLNTFSFPVDTLMTEQACNMHFQNKRLTVSYNYFSGF